MTEGLSNRLPVLAAEIKAAHAGVLDAAKTAAERSIEAGHALIEAKKLVKHGQWLPWLKEHCGMAERTAQLYMHIAKLGLDSATVADLGLKAAAKVLWVAKTPDYNPFAHCTEDEKRQWILFMLWDAPWPHVEWILQRQFRNPEEWLGEEGQAFRKSYKFTKASEDYRERFRQFAKENEGGSTEEIEADAWERENAREQMNVPAKRKRRAA